MVIQSLADILVEELHNHLYLKSLYCNDRWKAYSAKDGQSNASSSSCQITNDSIATEGIASNSMILLL